jgi:hypothetical protein
MVKFRRVVRQPPSSRCFLGEERIGGSNRAMKPFRRSLFENSTSSISGISAKPPSCTNISLRTKSDWLLFQLGIPPDDLHRWYYRQCAKDTILLAKSSLRSRGDIQDPVT